MSTIKKLILATVVGLVILAGALIGAAWYWVERPVDLDADRIAYIVESGSGPRQIASLMQREGIHIHPDAFVLYARLTGQDTRLQAGAYEAVRGDSVRSLLERMASGDMMQTRLTLVEGWSYSRIRQALRDKPEIRQTLDDISDEALLERLGADVSSPEGIFHPDTYVFVPGSTDFDILRRAYEAQREILEQAWANRAADLPVKTPYEALILASIVEKETGVQEDRGKVAGVFVNRLRIGMPLQTDPTVIYGMGDRYQGRIRKRDLQTDTPWNTYTRGGLPPTPIASPGRAALEAALNPDEHDYLYFVARGDGTSEFSKSLSAHNRAVAKYILNRGK